MSEPITPSSNAPPACHAVHHAPHEEVSSLPKEALATANRTEPPDALKAGIESPSGTDLSNVRVHGNSDQPAQLNALACAQGEDIHVAPGQERHLPREAWQAVQQRPGRVESVMQTSEEMAISYDAALEREADEMGAQALRMQAPAASKVSSS